MRPRWLPTTLSCVLALFACKRDDHSAEPSSAGSTAIVPPELEGDAVEVSTSAPESIDCARRPMDFGPVIVTASRYAGRHAASATKFSEVRSTQEQPAEVCVVSGLASS